jgi:hypothetical protein
MTWNKIILCSQYNNLILREKLKKILKAQLRLKTKEFAYFRLTIS